ncbi:unnamed protein product, partial [Polarella glacialis]
MSGDNNVDMTVLRRRRVLVLHVGGANQRIPAFSLLPDLGGNSSPGCRALSTIDLLLEGLTVLARSCPAGLFVVSSEDSFLSISQGFCERFAAASRSASLPSSGSEEGRATVVAMALPVKEVAGKHGAYLLDKDGAVRRLLYRPSEAELLSIAKLPMSSGTGESIAWTAKACGVVFFDEIAATKLLHLAFDPVFEPCSFLGIDNGSQPAGFSLFLDLLASLGSDVDLESFASSPANDKDLQFRQQLWRSLHGRIRLTAVVAEPEDQCHHYVRTTQEFVTLLSSLEGSRGADTRNQTQLFQAYVDSPTSGKQTSRRSGFRDACHSMPEEARVHSSACVVNSVLWGICRVAANSIIESSSLEDCTVGEGSICTGLKRLRGLEVPSHVSLQQVSLLSDKEAPIGCLITLMLGDEAKQEETDGSFLGQSWEDLLRDTGLSQDDIWPPPPASTGAAGASGRPCPRTLRFARLFPVVPCEELEGGPGLPTASSSSTSSGSLNRRSRSRSSSALLWAEYVTAMREEPATARTLRLDLWRRRWRQLLRCTQRLSLSQIARLADVGAELEWQDAVAAEANVLRTRKLLLEYPELPIGHILDDEVRHGRWGLLDIFDAVAAEEDTPLAVAARALAQVAEVLAAFAGTQGGLRSGSARNPEWRGALSRLAHESSRRSAVLEMKELRSRWIKDGPVALIRAARHYEAAAQVLILTAVATCSEFITLSPSPEPRRPGCWAVVEAPARVDLAGGWTDT